MRIVEKHVHFQPFGSELFNPVTVHLNSSDLMSREVVCGHVNKRDSLLCCGTRDCHQDFLIVSTVLRSVAVGDLSHEDCGPNFPFPVVIGWVHPSFYESINFISIFE